MSFLKLIGGLRQYRIPPFQRSYAWEKAERETLWIDLLAQYEQLAKVWHLPASEREEQLRKVPTHYMGAAVTANPTALGVPRSDIIDGQQRITSLLLLLCALRDVRIRAARQAGSADAELEEIRQRFNRQYLLNVDEQGDDRLRLVPQTRDRRAFMACVNYTGTSLLTVASLGLTGADSPRTLQAYTFFKTELRRQSVDAQKNPQLARFASLYPLDLNMVEEAAKSRLSFFVNESDDHEDVNAIFESLNAKGKPLKQMDLVRNYVFMVLGVDAEDVLATDWDPIERDHLMEDEIESLIWADIVSRGRNVLQNRTYRAVQALLRESGGGAGSAREYVRDLHRSASYYEHLLRPATEPSPGIAGAIRSLNRAGGKTAHPIGLWLYQERHAKRCKDGDMVAGLGIAESFIVRRFLAGLSPNNLNSIFGGVLMRIHAGAFGDDGISAVDRLRKALAALGKDWPDDDELLRGIETNDFYHQGKVGQRIYVLDALEHRLHPHSLLLIEESDNSIEHVMPQTPTTRWESDLKEAGDDPLVVQNKFLHSLGNLTLVTPLENLRLGQKPFEEKVPLYAGSAYSLTKAIASDFGDATDGGRLWFSKSIGARARVLHAAAIALWERPAAAGETAPVADRIDLDEGEQSIPFTSGIEEQVSDVSG